MEWSGVVTFQQRARLLAATKDAIKQFLAYIEKNQFQGEIEIAGRYGIGDKFAIRNGTFVEMTWNYAGAGQFDYSEVSDFMSDAIIVRYGLTPEHFRETQAKIEKESRQKIDNGLAADQALENLRALCDSPAVPDLIHDIVIAENKYSGIDLRLTPNGLYQTWPIGPVHLPEAAYPGLIKYYSLTSSHLRRLRAQIEA